MTCSNDFVPCKPSGSVVSTLDVGGYVLKFFQAVCSGNETLSKAPLPVICTRRVMGSPTATFVGPAVTLIVYSPTAPLKLTGTLVPGNGSDCTFAASLT